MDAVFFINSILFGVGLAMDAFSVSLANGLNEPKMSRNKALGIPGVFAFFQFAMPMIGWVCVHTILQIFTFFEAFIPLIALALLLYLGGKMIWEGATHKEGEEKVGVGFGALMLQGVATSIDALSVGFTIADYGFIMALTECLIIAAVTFIICRFGIFLGKKFGTKLSGKAEILGGVILICIGIEIAVSSFFK